MRRWDVLGQEEEEEEEEEESDSSSTKSRWRMLKRKKKAEEFRGGLNEISPIHGKFAPTIDTPLVGLLAHEPARADRVKSMHISGHHSRSKDLLGFWCA